MRSTRISTIACIVLLLGAERAVFAQGQYPFRNPDLPVEQRTANILSLMTLDEKLAALGTSSEVRRLGIPNAGSSEGIHGLVQGGMMNALRGGQGVPTTQFAQTVGMALTWDPELIRRAGAVVGVEARYIYHNQKYERSPLVVWGPNADLARDPRWGRIDESYGEDAFFNGTMAAAYAGGLQGDNPKYWQAASLVKHFLANSNENGRYGSSSDFDERLFREYYSVPFRMAFVNGGAKSYMASYNAWNRVPMTVHPVLKSLLARDWGVDGIVSTDAGSVRNMVTKHKYYPGTTEAVAGCIKAGINQFLDNYIDGAREALKRKLLAEEDLDAALRGKFRVVIRLGLLDPPESVPYTSTASAEPWNTEAHKTLARQVARESIVLLKNSGNLLPLDRHKLKSIAVFGSRSNTVLTDLYSGEPPYRVSPLQGLRTKLGTDVGIVTATGFFGNPAAIAKSADAAIVFVGNDPRCNRLSPILGFGKDDSWCENVSEGMENSDRKTLDLDEEELIKEVFAANPKTIVVLLSSFPYTINWTQQNVPAILHSSQNAQEIGTALADVLFGDYNPAGRLVVTWPRSLDQLPPMMDYNIRHGRTYMYFKGEPLFPFGYGLSYTTFAYSNLRTSGARLSRDGEVTVSVDVKNTGNRPGDEVVQLYVKHEQSRVERPLKELRGFQRITVPPGETRTVQMLLKADSLAYWDEKAARFVLEQEPLRIMVGGSSAAIAQRTTVALVP
jgi:beta-glucosidase